jgi:hypothetical protein
MSAVKKNLYKYCSPELKKWLEIFNAADQVSKEPLQIVTVLNGIVQPFLAVDHFAAHGGVLNSKLLPVKESETLTRGTRWVRPNKDVIEDQISKTKLNHIDEDVLFMGVLPNHFGHVMLDIASCLWPLLDPKHHGKKIVFLEEIENARPLANFIALFGIPLESILFVQEPVQFKTVHIPQPALNLYLEETFTPKGYANPIIRDIYARINENVKGAPAFPPKKVYFSRTRLNGGIRCFGEQQIENIFAKNGYSVFYPETMSFEDQIRVVRNADSYACVNGTLMHHSLFMKDGSEMIVLERGRINSNNHQPALNKIKNIKMVSVSASLDPEPACTPGPGNNFMPHLIGGTEQLKNFLNDRKFLWSEDDLKFDWATYMNYIVDLGRCKKFDMHAELTARANWFAKN